MDHAGLIASLKRFTHGPVPTFLHALAVAAAGPAHADSRMSISHPAPLVRPHYPDVSRPVGPDDVFSTPSERGLSSQKKLDTDLQRLVEMSNRTRGWSDTGTVQRRAMLDRLLGIDPESASPAVRVAIHLVSPDTPTDFGPIPVVPQMRQGNIVFAGIPVSSLKALAEWPSVVSVEAIHAMSFPQPPRTPQAQSAFPSRSAVPPSPMRFNHEGLTGKGVVVADIDSGIEWNHPDFRNPDGTTRILYLYDMTDSAWTTSHHTIGTEPPLKDAQGEPLGTLYTRAQINAALLGTGVCRCVDVAGHGTATAGTAAGNGRAAGGSVLPGTYPGVAPETDLMIVKYDFQYPSNAIAQWLFQKAAECHESCVINMSFGEQDTPHNGSRPDERSLDTMVGAGISGRAICVSAGNDGQQAMHAGGFFGPRATAGQVPLGPGSIPIEMNLPAHSFSRLECYFNDADDWGLCLQGLRRDANGRPEIVHLYHLKSSEDAPFRTELQADAMRYVVIPMTQEQQRQMWLLFKPQRIDDSTDHVSIDLLGGAASQVYKIWAYGATRVVPDGRFDFYLTATSDAEHVGGSFGRGVENRFMIESPGNAANVITVGSYDAFDQWRNQSGTVTLASLKIGALSGYSCPGYRRDGTVKPEIAAPGQYLIAAYAQESHLDQGPALRKITLTPDGRHVAWAGTSAAAPYVAGVVALMLQKNPMLDTAQIKHILQTTAGTDIFTGDVPNTQWGYGKVNPAAAIAATPAAH